MLLISTVSFLGFITIALGLIFVLCGAICSYVSFLCINGKIKPNGAAGVRLNFSRNYKLYNQERYWYDINRYGGNKSLYVSIIWLLLGIVILILPVDPNIKMGAIIAVLLLVTAAFIVNAWLIIRYAEKLVAQG